MKYLLLIYQNEAEAKPESEAAGQAMMAEYGKFTRGIKESGHYTAGEALQPIATATTVRVRDGKTMTTDGPFAETREQLCGFYLVDAPHLDDATAMAAQIPGARKGCIEVRPVWQLPVSN
jgi:hypothetical protein